MQCLGLNWTSPSRTRLSPSASVRSHMPFPSLLCSRMFSLRATLDTAALAQRTSCAARPHPLLWARRVFPAITVDNTTSCGKLPCISAYLWRTHQEEKYSVLSSSYSTPASGRECTRLRDAFLAGHRRTRVTPRIRPCVSFWPFRCHIIHCSAPQRVLHEVTESTNRHEVFRITVLKLSAPSKAHGNIPRRS